MSERGDYNPGEFCWVDLASPDTDASTSYYGELLGWEFEPAPGPAELAGGYGNFMFKGKTVAGMGSIQNEGQPVAWSSYVNVADADETAAKARDVGGTIFMEPFDVPGDAGRMAIIQDPEGAVLSLWQAGRHRGAELVNEIGCWTWNQLATRDIEGARRFYGEVFGWDLTQVEEAPPDSPFFMWQVEGQRWAEGLAGVQLMGSDMPAEAPPHWQVYFCAESAAAAIETTERAGGKNLFGPQRIPVGTLAVLSDPHGAGFGIIEPDYPEAR